MIDPANYTVGLPVAASTYATRVDASLHILHIGMAFIFVLWGIFFTYCLIRFRKGGNPQAQYPQESHKSHAISFVPDAAVLIFELWLIFIIGLPLWADIKEDIPMAKDSTVIQLVAEQFAWNFHYSGPDGQFAKLDAKQVDPTSNNLGIDYTDPAAKDDYVYLNELHVPLGKPVVLYMTAKDVIHSFFVPEFRNKQDIVPGMRTMYWFEANKIGTYEIGCAQLCGLGHYRMKGMVVVQTPEEFEVWQKERLKELKEAQAS